IFLDYLNYLVEQNKMEAALGAWSRLLELGLAFEPARAFAYLDGLIRHRRVEELVAAWQALVERHPVVFRRPRYDSNLLLNGDFESEILNGGLDWRVTPVEGVVVRVDSLTFFDGTRSLEIRFDGSRNTVYHHVLQYVPVRPRTLYRFMGYVRAEGITTDSGPRFQLYDVYQPDRFFLSTENVRGTMSWTLEQLEFTTGPETRLLALRLARPPSPKLDNQIAGTAWIDRLSLTPVE
ncbi:MAG: hypothetical protein HY653_02615, partial [Acidobacteria bacterium]|nr:hypothetical protein [Acidobacteriota bacterium]